MTFGAWFPRPVSRFRWLLAAGLAVTVGPGMGSAEGAGDGGRAASRVLVVGSSAFYASCVTAPDSIVVAGGLQRGFAYVGGGCPLSVTLTLPEEAEVSRIEADVCDSSALGDVQVTLFQADRLATTQATMAAASTAGSPGCVTLVLVPGVPVSSFGGYLGVQVDLGASTSPAQVSLQGLRVVHTGP